MLFAPLQVSHESELANCPARPAVIVVELLGPGLAPGRVEVVMPLNNRTEMIQKTEADTGAKCRPMFGIYRDREGTQS